MENSKNKKKSDHLGECLQISSCVDPTTKQNCLKIMARQTKNMKNSKNKLKPNETIIFKTYVKGAKDIKKGIIKDIETHYQQIAQKNNSVVYLPSNVQQEELLDIINKKTKIN